MNNIKKIFFLLDSNERKYAIFLIFMIVIMAFMEMIGIASILPFMTVLSNPNIIEKNNLLNLMFQTSSNFGVENIQQFTFILGILVFIVFIFSLLLKAITTYLQLRFSLMREFSIGKRLIEGYLNQKYSWFLFRNSSDIKKTILSETGQVVASGISPLLELFAKSMVTILIIILLIFANPKISLFIGLSLGFTYAIIFYFVKNYLNQAGNEKLINNELRFRTVSEAFGASKEIKLRGLEQIYVKNFSNSAERYAKTQAASQAIALLPRFVLEGIAFGGMLLIILFFIADTGNFNEALPIITLYIFAGYRLLPAIQQIYNCLTLLSFISPSIDKLYEELQNNKPIRERDSGDKEILKLKKNICLKNVNFNYPNTSRTALKNINLNIHAKSTVGFIGETGSGKTTLVDIILGILEPQQGSLEVDGKIIKGPNSSAWQRSIGYVPQQIYLADDTIIRNIAFGVDAKDVDHKLIERAAKIANIHDFIVNELPEKYLTKIGERGIRLSGGQLQRIGIARALYHKPQVLILDEATSALDYNTEELIVDAINNLNKEITIILIAHRLNTVKICDVIFQLKQGQIIKHGTFSEILKT